MSVGEKYGLIHSGLDSMDIRRIEAGIMNSGSDFDLTMNPYQVGLGKFVDLNKDQFIGKEALKVAPKDKLILGVLCDKSEPLVLGEVSVNDEKIGLITAAAWSPYLNSGIGYVRLVDKKHKSGEEIEIYGIDGIKHTAKLIELPFYDKEKKIPRGLKFREPNK